MFDPASLCIVRTLLVFVALGSSAAWAQEFGLDLTGEVDAETKAAKRDSKLHVVVEGEITGARLVLDGVDVGELPQPVRTVTAGTHNVLVKRTGYRDFAKKIWIDEGKTRKLSVKLEPAGATYRLSSTPSGAEVEIDGRSAGKTPMVAQLPEGKHEIRYSLEGHEPELISIESAAGDDETIDRVLRASGGAVAAAAPRKAAPPAAAAPPMELDITDEGTAEVKPESESDRPVDPVLVPQEADPDLAAIDAAPKRDKPSLLGRWYVWAGGAAAVAAIVGGTVLIANATSGPGPVQALTPEEVCGGPCDVTINGR